MNIDNTYQELIDAFGDDYVNLDINAQYCIFVDCITSDAVTVREYRDRIGDGQDSLERYYHALAASAAGGASGLAALD